MDATEQLSPEAEAQKERLMPLFQIISGMNLTPDESMAVALTVLANVWLRNQSRFADLYLGLNGALFTSIARIKGIEPPAMSIIKPGQEVKN